MGRMDVSALRYLSKDEMRVLMAVEQGMKNHDLVPVELIATIANLKHGGAFKALGVLLRAKLLRHDRKKYDGYSLNYLGYDYLAFNTLARRGVLKAMGRQIGVGKESDVFIALDETEEKTLVVKMHRLGRTSFRKVKEKRDYHQHRKFANWLYLSHLAAEKEFAFMKILKEAGFPVPDPVDCNRHCVVMSLVDAYPLTQIRELSKPGKVFAQLMELHIRLAQCGLVHCDFNEFNVMINDKEELTVIDFPQMVSTSHKNAAYYFNRDVECLRLFFERRYGFQASSVPTLADCTTRIMELDKLAAASGFT
jgi:RIO kinase 2